LRIRTEARRVLLLRRSLITGSAFKRVVAPESVAAVIAEPVLGEGGFVVLRGTISADSGNLPRHGILFIADEVQSGIGRTGKWFASEHLGSSRY